MQNVPVLVSHQKPAASVDTNCIAHPRRFEAMGEEMMSGSSGGSSSGGYEGDEGEVRLALQTAALFSWPADV